MAQSSASDPTLPDSAHSPRSWSSAIVESAPNGIIVVDQSGKIVLTNEKARSLFGYSKDEFLNLTIEDLVPKQARGHHSHYRASFHRNPETRVMGSGRDLSAVRKDGSEFPVEIGLNPLSVPGQELVLSSIVDITKRKEAELKIREYAAKLEFQAAILQNVHDAVFYLDRNGIILEWNEGAGRIFERGLDDAVGHHVSRIFAQDNFPLFENLEKSFRHAGIAEETIHCRNESGRDVFVKATVKRMERDGESGYLVCASDITERKKLEAELLKIAEEEQRKTGQDIHDDLCSQLSGIGCLTKVLENQLAEDRRKEAELVKNVGEMVAAAGITARNIAQGLVPSILENQGLAGALRDLVNANRKSYDIDIHLTIPDKEAASAITQEICIQLYRIAQEAITVAACHNNADSIHVNASVKDHRFELSVEDDGRGLTEDTVSRDLEMITMRHRAELIHASFNVHTNPGGGTTLHCSVPLPSS